ACGTTGTMPASSVASSVGRRNGTSALQRRASSASAGLSVETTTRVRRVASRADAMAWPSRESRPRMRRFLPGSPLDPPRAGMTPRTYGPPAKASDPHPAALGRGATRGLDDLHRLEPIPPVAPRDDLAAHAREEVARLLQRHVVELAGERVDF